jgi:hypothetical protein
MRSLLLALALLLAIAAPAAADTPAASPFSFSFSGADPCTGADMTITFSGTTFRHEHENGNTYHASVAITTTSGYVGRGVEVSVDHERIFVINHVLTKSDGDRMFAHVYIAVNDDGSLRADRARVECIGRSATVSI